MSIARPLRGMLASASMAFVAALSAPASAATLVAPQVAPPLGFIRFCAERPDECDGSPSAEARFMDRSEDGEYRNYWRSAFSQGALLSPGAVRRVQRDVFQTPPEVEQRIGLEGDPIRLSGQDRQALSRLNRQINMSIRPRTDAALYGVNDYWALPLSDHVGQGDCEDFVLEKRRALRAAGMPAAALSIAVVGTKTDVTHAVLLVNSDKGVLVLDNLTPGVQRLSQVQYRIIARQAFGSPSLWVGAL